MLKSPYRVRNKKFCKNCHIDITKAFKRRYQCEPCRSKEVWNTAQAKKIEKDPENYWDCDNCDNSNHVRYKKCRNCKEPRNDA